MREGHTLGRFHHLLQHSTHTVIHMYIQSYIHMYIHSLYINTIICQYIHYTRASRRGEFKGVLVYIATHCLSSILNTKNFSTQHKVSFIALLVGMPLYSSIQHNHNPYHKLHALSSINREKARRRASLILFIMKPIILYRTENYIHFYCVLLPASGDSS